MGPEFIWIVGGDCIKITKRFSRADQGSTFAVAERVGSVGKTLETMEVLVVKELAVFSKGRYRQDAKS